MKATIQVEDPRGENVSPMDEKTITADCQLDVWLFNEWIHISEEGGDMGSEGANVDLLALVQEFVTDCENDVVRERNEEPNPLKRHAPDEQLPQLLRLQETLRRSAAVNDAAISRIVAYARSDDEEWNKTVELKNKAEAALRRRRRPEEPSL